MRLCVIIFCAVLTIISCDKSTNQKNSDNKFLGKWSGYYFKIEAQDTIDAFPLTMLFYTEDRMEYTQDRVLLEYEWEADSLTNRFYLTPVITEPDSTITYATARYDYRFFGKLRCAGDLII